MPRPLASDMSKPSGPLQRLSPFAPAAKAVEPAVAFLRPAIRHGDAPASAARTFASNEDSIFMSRCSLACAVISTRFIEKSRSAPVEASTSKADSAPGEEPCRPISDCCLTEDQVRAP